MGARPLYFNDTRLMNIKYNDTIQFAAGFALFRNATSEWDENWAVTQSWSNAPFFSYKVADTVVKDGVDSCDLLDEEGNCLSLNSQRKRLLLLTASSQLSMKVSRTLVLSDCEHALFKL